MAKRTGFPILLYVPDDLIGPLDSAKEALRMPRSKLVVALIRDYLDKVREAYAAAAALPGKEENK